MSVRLDFMLNYIMELLCYKTLFSLNSQVGGVTMVGFPDGKESLGPARLTGEVMDIVEQIPSIVQQMTGHDVSVKK